MTAPSDISLIDKTSTRLTLGVAVSLMVSFGYFAYWLASIEHAVGNANSTLREVRAELARIAESAVISSKDIIVLQEVVREHERRLQVLEKR